MQASRTIAGTLRPSRIGLGMAPLGGLRHQVDQESAAAAIHAAWDCGLRYFDTAPYYGAGLSEERAGRVLREYDRDEYILSTKVGQTAYVTADGSRATRPDFSYDATMAGFEQSLARLGVDRVDIVFVHDPVDAFDAAIYGSFRALLRLREEGVIRAIGAGMNQWEMITQFLDRVPLDCVMPAGRLTLLDQSAATTLIPACRRAGVAMIGAGVLNSGVLARPEPGALYDYQPASDAVIDRARRIGRVCADHGVSLLAAALQFPLRYDVVATVLVGAHPAAEVRVNAAAAAAVIPDDLWADLEARSLIPPLT